MTQNLEESVKVVKNALEAGGVYPDAVSKNKDGHIIVRDGFFYKSGRTADGHTYKIKKALDAAGIKHSIVDDGEHNAPFHGGASVARNSHFYTHIKLHEDTLNEAPALPKGARHLGDFVPGFMKDLGDQQNLAFYRHTKDDVAHAAAEAHLKELKSCKRRGIPHPALGRIPRGADIAHGENESAKYNYVYDKTKKLDESVANRPGHFAFTHTPGDTESERKLAKLKSVVSDHNKTSDFKLRVLAKGRMGKDNPNAEKYKRDHTGRTARPNSHGYQTITLSDAKHHDLYVAPRNKSDASNRSYEDQKTHHAIARNVTGNFKQATGLNMQEDVNEAYPSAASMARKAKAVKQARAIANGYANQKSGKWSSQSYKTEDGRWASKDVKEEAGINEETVGYKHYRFTAGQKTSNNEIGSPEHITAHPGKMKALGVHTKQGDSYGHTSHVIVTNTVTGEQSHHNVYQREWGNGEDRPTVSIRHLKNIHPGHTNALKHYLSGKTKLTEETLVERYRRATGRATLTELSRATLGSYIKGASNDVANKAVEYGTKKAERDEVDRITNRHMKYADKDTIHKALKTTSDDVEGPRVKAAKRIGGIAKAVKKLTEARKKHKDLTNACIS